jgi:hypothetical protein
MSKSKRRVLFGVIVLAVIPWGGYAVIICEG